jgi:hypothetical protein
VGKLPSRGKAHRHIARIGVEPISADAMTHSAEWFDRDLGRQVR